MLTDSYKGKVDTGLVFELDCNFIHAAKNTYSAYELPSIFHHLGQKKIS